MGGGGEGVHGVLFQYSADNSGFKAPGLQSSCTMAGDAVSRNKHIFGLAAHTSARSEMTKHTSLLPAAMP